MLSIALKIRLPWWWRPYARGLIFATWLAAMVTLTKKLTVGARVAMALTLTVLAGTALADPPPGADMSLAPWFHSLRIPEAAEHGGLTCCSPADCRPVRYRAAGDHYEAFIDTKTFPDDGQAGHGMAPNEWVAVPDEVILKRYDNPTGEGVACWYAGHMRCFVPASGT